MSKLLIQEQNFTNCNNVIINSNFNVPAQLSGTQVSVTVQMPPVNNLANPYIIHADNITFSPGGILNVDNIDALFVMSGFSDIEISHNVVVNLKNHDPIQNITVNSGSLDFTNDYSNPNGAPVKFDLILKNGGKFFYNTNSPLANINVVTMDSGTIFEFDTATHHYSITAPRDGFVINDLVKMARIAEFINSEFNNSITNPHVENNKLQGLREYANYPDKNALKEIIEMNFDVNCTLVDNFINDNNLHINGVCANLDGSILGDLPENILAHINSYNG